MQADARAALAAEWASASPSTPEAVAAFYRTSTQLAADLAAWHETAARQQRTEWVVHVAQTTGAKSAVDIGCGAGQDLRALADAGLMIHGVEPNLTLREALLSRLADTDGVLWDDVEHAPIETADLLICIDVLEHIPDPESFLGSIARRARLGAVLIEQTSTYDIGTPLHLRDNWGWQPGHCLEAAGWTMIDQREYFRVWQRVEPHMLEHTAIMLCAYRGAATPTFRSIMTLQGSGWRFLDKTGDALIDRSRSQIVHAWHTQTADDVFLMVDDDITFTQADAEKVVALARQKRSIACAAYPVANASHTACRGLSPHGSLDFGPDLEPVEIEYAGTGFMACHRDVLDALAPTLPLCHPDQGWSFRPFFLPMVAPMMTAYGFEVPAYLSEDWAFCHRARQVGFKVWLERTVVIDHQKGLALNVRNMAAAHELLKGGQ